MDDRLNSVQQWIARVRFLVALALAGAAPEEDRTLLFALLWGVCLLYGFAGLFPSVRQRCRLYHTIEASLSLDVTLAAIFVFLTGGLSSPFLVLLFLPVLEACLSLSPRATVGAALYTLCWLGYFGALKGTPGSPFGPIMLSLCSFSFNLICFMAAFGALAGVLQQSQNRVRLVEEERDALLQFIDRDIQTGVLNSHTFLKRFDSELSRAIGLNAPLALILVQVNWTQQIKERKGPEAVEEALMRLIGVLSHRLRPHDVLGRTGENRFAIVLPNVCDQSALAWMKQIRSQQDPTVPSFSVGGASYPHGGADLQTLLQAAERSLTAEPLPVFTQVGRRRWNADPSSEDATFQLPA